MNLNYVGSVAERFMKFKTSVAGEEVAGSESIHNNFAVFIPKSLAAAQFATGAYDAAAVTADKAAVIKVTADNRNDVLATTGSLASQYAPIWNDGANTALVMYCIVFDDTDFAPTVTAGGIEWLPLTKAFKEFYFIAFFKVLFSEHYNGAVSTEEGSAFDDSNFYDMALCLSLLCENETELSAFICETQLEVFEEGAEDTNACKVMSLTEGEELDAAKTLLGSTKTTRAANFWGFLHLIGGKRTWLIVHNGAYMLPIIFGLYFSQTNASGTYIGNQLDKIRLTNDKVKPTGLPSRLNSAVNLNLGSYIYDNLDAKFVCYFNSISDTSLNNAQAMRSRTVAKVPFNIHALISYINYTASQAIADWRDSIDTLTNPHFCNEDSYKTIQSIVQNTVNAFAGLGRLSGISFSFPSFSSVRVGNSLKGNLVWSAQYEDTLGAVSFSGQVGFLVNE